jgi:8-oxo-dGTP pyrophosphatase MutT (NUDIX family)
MRKFGSSDITRSMITERQWATPAAAAFAERVHARLQAGRRLQLEPSDFDLNPDMERSLADRTGLRPAAVLIPVVARTELTLLLTQRTDTLQHHAGQIAFPGGRIDPGDRDATAAALREAEEEIGLAARHITPLGFLDTYQTGTGFAIAPLIALVEPGFTITPEPGEVADVFEVPLGFLMNPVNHQLRTGVWKGSERRFYAMPYENRYIWGATAGILKNMHERLFTP